MKAHGPVEILAAELSEPDRKRFWSKVDKSSDCWIWNSYRNVTGYGRFLLNGKSRFAARVSFAMAFGKMPSGLVVCHHCDTPSCVNPSHLFLGTLADNVRDMVSKERNTKGEKHPSAKLTKDAVRLMRRLYRVEGYKPKALAEMFGVTTTNVHAIMAGYIWLSVKEAA